MRTIKVKRLEHNKLAMNEFKSGIIFSAVGRYSNLIIQISVNAVLSRILTPADYGIVAIVQIFLAFFSMLADMGFGPAIVQSKSLNKKDIQIIFKFSIYMAIILGVIFILLGYPVSLFYRNPVYIKIFLILGVSVFFHALLVVPKALLLKSKSFRAINVVMIVTGILQGIVSVGLALLNFKYYSIIIGGIIQAILTFTFYYRQTRISPAVAIRLEPLKKIWYFSRNQFLFNFINYFSRNLDNILIGRYLGISPLAFYNKAYQISLYPNQLLTGIITPVIQPLMSEYEHDLNIIKKVYLRMTRILANIGIPLSVFCFFSAHDIILFLFGNQWGDSVLSFKILAISIWLQMISSSTGAIYQSANRSDLLLYSGLQSMIFNVLSISIGVYLGSIETIATMLVVSFSLNFIINNYLLMYKAFNSPYIDIFQALSKPILLGLMQILTFFFLPQLYFGVFINLLIKGIIFIFVLLLGLLVTNQFKELKEIIIV